MTRANYLYKIVPTVKKYRQDRYHVTEAGSFDGSKSSWSFVVLATWPSGTRLHGFARGLVKLQGERPYVGATEHSSLSGEQSAILWAHVWILQKPSGVPAYLWADCLAALGQTEGKCQFQEYDVLAKACRSVAAAAESAGQMYADRYQHVHSHKGHPYNELADVLAKAQYLPDTPIPTATAQLESWIDVGDVEWLWLIVEIALRPSLWPTCRGSFVTDSGGDPVPDHKYVQQCLLPHRLLECGFGRQSLQ